MCQYTSRMPYGEDKIIYDMVSFHSEDRLFWLFNCQPVEFHCHGRIHYLENQPMLIICFAKKKQIGEKMEVRDGERVKVPIYESRQPPSFYEKLRNRKMSEKYGVAEKQRDFKWKLDESMKDAKNLAAWDDELVDREAADHALEEIRRKNAERGYDEL